MSESILCTWPQQSKLILNVTLYVPSMLPIHSCFTFYIKITIYILKIYTTLQKNVMALYQVVLIISMRPYHICIKDGRKLNNSKAE